MGVYKRSYKSRVAWYSRIQHQGKVYVAGPFSEKWRAEEESGRMHRARRRGSLKQEYGETQRAKLHTLKDAVESYSRSREQQVQRGERAVSSWKVEQHVLDVLLRSFEDYLLMEIQPSDIEAFRFTRRSKDGVKGATLNRNLASLSMVFQHAIQRGWIAENPVAKIKRSSEPSGGWTWLRPEEAEQLLVACKEGPSYLFPLVLTALYTGMRRGELLNLLWRDVDLVQAHAEIVQSKAGRRRAVPLRHEVVKTLGKS